jgi:hypothetical protein
VTTTSKTPKTPATMMVDGDDNNLFGHNHAPDLILVLGVSPLSRTTYGSPFAEAFADCCQKSNFLLLLQLSKVMFYQQSLSQPIWSTDNAGASYILYFHSDV